MRKREGKMKGLRESSVDVLIWGKLFLLCLLISLFVASAVGELLELLLPYQSLFDHSKATTV